MCLIFFCEMSDLFDIKIPNYAQSPRLPNLQYKLARLTQLHPYSYTTSSRTGPKVIIKNYGEVTVREMIETWENSEPDYWFEVDQSKMNYKFHEKKPVIPTYGEKLEHWWLTR